MPRTLWLSFACFLILMSPAFAETDGEVYEEVDKIIGDASDEVRGNLAAFIQANEKPLAKARADLSALIARLNKDGRSQLATSIQKRVNTLEDTVQKRASAKVPIVQPPKKPVLERLEGKWDHPDSKVATVVGPQGTFKEVHKSDGRLHVEGTVRPAGDDMAEAKCTNGWSYHYRFIDDDILLVRFYGEDGREPFPAMLKFRAK